MLTLIVKSLRSVVLEKGGHFFDAHLFKNAGQAMLVGIGLLWPTPQIRALPVHAAEALADLSIRSRWIPFLFILVVFIVVPFVLIFLLR